MLTQARIVNGASKAAHFNVLRYTVTVGNSGHHIVAQGAKAAEPARRILKSLQIDIDAAENGVALPTKFHNSLHTEAYYRMVNTAAKKWKTKEQAIKGLEDIARYLMKKSGKLK